MHSTQYYLFFFFFAPPSPPLRAVALISLCVCAQVCVRVSKGGWTLLSALLYLSLMEVD